jgi:membrane-bound lytic murein transglycosylase D
VKIAIDIEFLNDERPGFKSRHFRSAKISALAPRRGRRQDRMAMRMRWISFFSAGILAAGAAPTPTPTQTPLDTDELYQVGQQLFDQYAPPEIKEQYAFPSKDELDRFASRLQQALDGNSLEGLADYEPEARAALAAARALPGYEDFADWLQLRVDEIDAARQAVARPEAPVGERPKSSVPLYPLWLARERSRPVPQGAAALMPVLQAAFSAERVPPELAWIAEAESTLNPSARSPAGARGLFQLMPDTAHALGLSTFLPDDRTDPEKSARAAARYLRTLYARFGSWPLALAAYNAGEGKVSRLLALQGATDYAGVASALPSETRMYVPKVCALVTVRTGQSLEALRPLGG